MKAPTPGAMEEALRKAGAVPWEDAGPEGPQDRARRVLGLRGPHGESWVEVSARMEADGPVLRVRHDRSQTGNEDPGWASPRPAGWILDGGLDLWLAGLAAGILCACCPDLARAGAADGLAWPLSRHVEARLRGEGAAWGADGALRAPDGRALLGGYAARLARRMAEACLDGPEMARASLRTDMAVLMARAVALGTSRDAVGEAWDLAEVARSMQA